VTVDGGTLKQNGNEVPLGQSRRLRNLSGREIAHYFAMIVTTLGQLDAIRAAA
jgi:hypothetical protein